MIINPPLISCSPEHIYIKLHQCAINIFLSFCVDRQTDGQTHAG